MRKKLKAAAANELRNWIPSLELTSLIALRLRSVLDTKDPNCYMLSRLIESGRYNVEARQYLVTDALEKLELKLGQSLKEADDIKHLIKILNVLSDPDQFSLISIEEDANGVWTVDATDGSYLVVEHHNEQRQFLESSGVFALDPFKTEVRLLDTLEKRNGKLYCAIAKETWKLLSKET